MLEVIIAICFTVLFIVAAFARTRGRRALCRYEQEVLNGRQRIRQAARDETYRQIQNVPINRKKKRLLARSIARKLETKKPS